MTPEEIRAHLVDATRRLDELPAWRDELIWRMREAGVPWKTICDAAGVTRTPAALAYERHQTRHGRAVTHDTIPGAPSV